MPLSDRMANAAVAIVLMCAVLFLRLDFSLWIIFLAVIFRNGIRRLLAIAAVVLFSLAFTPFSWPTYWLSLGLMICLWHETFSATTLWRCVAESLVIGFSVCWLITGFFHSSVTMWSVVIRGAGCLVYSWQFIAIAVATHSCRQISITAAAIPIAIVAAISEMIQACLGLTWAVTNPILTIATTPVAQWSHTFTPFGLSFISYCIGFLLAPDFAERNFKRWKGPLVGSTILLFLWISGMVIESRVAVQSLGFSAMLVQPHVQFKPPEKWQPWKTLHPLTLESLKTSGQVDLVVWPESSLSESWYTPHTEEANSFPERLTIQDFKSTLLPQYRTNCMLGVTIVDPTVVVKYGLEVPQLSRFNCGCLVATTSEVDCHEKIQLVPT